MTEATARPWHYFSGSHGIYGGHNLETCVAITKGPLHNSERQDANGTFIVRAVETLDAIAKLVREPNYGSAEIMRQTLEQIEALTSGGSI